MRVASVVAVALFVFAGSATSVVAESSAQQRLLKAPLGEARKTAVLLIVEADRQQEAIRRHGTAQASDSPSKLLPSRVYWYRPPDKRRWYMVLTNGRGNLGSDPVEYVRMGSVLPGRYLGAKNPTQHFFLNEQLLWVPTFHPERLDLWVVSEPPLIKMVEYRELMPLAGKGKPGGKK